jgi:hypothetical protein
MKPRGRLVLLALLTPALLVPAALSRADTYPRQPGVDVVHYAFQLTLSDDTDVIEGETSVEFRVVRDGLATLTLDQQLQPGPSFRLPIELGLRATRAPAHGRGSRGSRWT